MLNLPRRILGLDIGGTGIRSLLWDGKRASMLRRYLMPTKREEFIKNLQNIIILMGKKVSIRAIGMGSAGIIEGTSVVWSPNIRLLKNFDFRKVIIGLPVLVDNDARTFARSEAVFFSKKYKRILFLTLGTGIGRAFFANGRVQTIKKLEYPETWEGGYQKIFYKEDPINFCKFLTLHLEPMIKKLKPQVIVVGGKVAHYRNFAKLFEANIALPVFVEKFSPLSGARGAALLFKNKIKI